MNMMLSSGQGGISTTQPTQTEPSHVDGFSSTDPSTFFENPQGFGQLELFREPNGVTEKEYTVTAGNLHALVWKMPVSGIPVDPANTERLQLAAVDRGEGKNDVLAVTNPLLGSNNQQLQGEIQFTPTTSTVVLQLGTAPTGSTFWLFEPGYPTIKAYGVGEIPEVLPEFHAVDRNMDQPAARLQQLRANEPNPATDPQTAIDYEMGWSGTVTNALSTLGANQTSIDWVNGEINYWEQIRDSGVNTTLANDVLQFWNSAAGAWLASNGQTIIIAAPFTGKTFLELAQIWAWWADIMRNHPDETVVGPSMWYPQRFDQKWN